MLPFQEIERKLQKTSTNQVVKDNFIGDKRPKLFAFDILASGDTNLCHLSYDARLSYLDQIL